MLCDSLLIQLDYNKNAYFLGQVSLIQFSVIKFGIIDKSYKQISSKTNLIAIIKCCSWYVFFCSRSNNITYLAKSFEANKGKIE